MNNKEAWEIIRKNIKLKKGSAVELADAIYKIRKLIDKEEE